MSELPLCPSCHAPVSARATQCVLCDAPLQPAPATSGATEALTSYATDETAAIRPELRQLYAELTQALAPTIRVTRLMAEGGMGLVFVGHDAALKRDVAIKVLSPALADDYVARTRFTREAERAAAVSHPNIVSVFQVGELLQSRIPYFVMQYVDGPTLADATGRVLPEWRVRRLVVEVAAALAAAHRRKLVHRDVKPGNVVLDGESGRALVLDFGISAALSSRRRSRSMRLTTEGMYLGTPTYMSPEQASGEEITPKSDIYSLGVVAYELLTGRPPFQGNARKVMAAHIKDRPPSLMDLRPDLTPELVTCIERCLEKDPARRPRAEEIVRHLEPETEHELEWPPPGLFPLRRAGARLLRMMTVSTLAILAFFTALALQPRAAVPTAQGTRLLRGWGDAVAAAGGAPGQVLDPGGATHADAQDAAVWSFVLASFVALMLVFAISLMLRTLRVARIAWRAREAGYPWHVLLQVAEDGWVDTGDLLNGAGAFAYVEVAERMGLLFWRRALVLCLSIGFVLATAAAALWLSGVLSPLARGAVVALTTAEALVVIVPAAVGLVAALLCLVPELRVRRREASGSRWHRGRRGGGLVNRELVQAWLAAYGEPPRPERRTMPPLAAIGLLALFGGAVAVGAIVVLTVVGQSTMRLVPSRARAAEWIEERSIRGSRAMPWPTIDAALGRAAEPIARPASPDAPRAFVAAFAVAGVRDAAARSSDLVQADGGDAAPAQARTDPLGAFRALAHAPLLPYFWPNGVADPVAAPREDRLDFSLGRLGAAARANADAGFGALAVGDTSGALSRAREDLAVARQLTRAMQPAGTAGAVLVGEAGAELMHAVARSGRDPSLGIVADSVDRALDALRDPVLERPDRLLLALFADPRDSAGLRLVADRALPPHARVRLLGAILAGYCLDSREVLFGVAPRRLAMYAAAARAVADVPGAWEQALRWRVASSSGAGLLPRVRACLASP